MYSIAVHMNEKSFLLSNLYIHVFFCGTSRKYLQSSILFYVKPREMSHFLILFMNDVCDDVARVQLINSVSRIVFEQGRNTCSRNLFIKMTPMSDFTYFLLRKVVIHLLLVCETE